VFKGVDEGHRVDYRPREKNKSQKKRERGVGTFWNIPSLRLLGARIKRLPRSARGNNTLERAGQVSYNRRGEKL